MKLNNKGYAITVIVFGILIVFIIVLSSLLITMNNSVKLNNVVKEDIIENIQLNADTTGMSLTERLEQLEYTVSNIKQETINEIYPVGSIYISTTDDSIDDVIARFGGKWEAYSQGRTLVGVGEGTDINGYKSKFEVNNTGGEYNHTLTINEMPKHTHTTTVYGNQGDAYIKENYKTNLWVVGQETVATTYGTSQVFSYAGGDVAHNNIQPYVAVYMYKRIE